jgi:hypothetical protein
MVVRCSSPGGWAKKIDGDLSAETCIPSNKEQQMYTASTITDVADVAAAIRTRSGHWALSAARPLLLACARIWLTQDEPRITLSSARRSSCAIALNQLLASAL